MENLDNKTIIGGALGILGGIAGTLIAQYAFKKRKESIDRQQKQSKPYYNKSKNKILILIRIPILQTKKILIRKLELIPKVIKIKTSNPHIKIITQINNRDYYEYNST